MSKGSFLVLSISVLRASKSIGVIEPAKTASVNSGATCFVFVFKKERKKGRERDKRSEKKKKPQKEKKKS